MGGPRAATRARPGTGSVGVSPASLSARVAAQRDADKKQGRRRTPALDFLQGGADVVGTAGVVGAPGQGRPRPAPAGRAGPRARRRARQPPRQPPHRPRGVRAAQPVDQHRDRLPRPPAGRHVVVQHQTVPVGQPDGDRPGRAADLRPGQPVAQKGLDVRVSQQGKWTERNGGGGGRAVRAPRDGDLHGRSPIAGTAATGSPASSVDSPRGAVPAGKAATLPRVAFYPDGKLIRQRGFVVGRRMTCRLFPVGEGGPGTSPSRSALGRNECGAVRPLGKRVPLWRPDGRRSPGMPTRPGVCGIVFAPHEPRIVPCPQDRKEEKMRTEADRKWW